LAYQRGAVFLYLPARVFAMGFAFGMPLGGIVLAGLCRKNELNLKSTGAVMLLLVLMGLVGYGCASVAGLRNQETPAGV
jgi:hypothetical protein